MVEISNTTQLMASAPICNDLFMFYIDNLGYLWYIIHVIESWIMLRQERSQLERLQSSNAAHIGNTRMFILLWRITLTGAVMHSSTSTSAHLIVDLAHVVFLLLLKPDIDYSVWSWGHQTNNQYASQKNGVEILFFL